MRSFGRIRSFEDDREGVSMKIDKSYCCSSLTPTVILSQRRRIPLMYAFLKDPSVSPCRTSLEDDNGEKRKHNQPLPVILSGCEESPIQINSPQSYFIMSYLITCDFLSLLINISPAINIQDVNYNLIINNFENCPVFTNS